MQLLLNVTDNNKVDLLFDFLKSLNYVSNVEKLDTDQDFEVPNWHKELVLERINTATPESFKPWNEVKNNLK
ncbi:MAG: hypothetical protein EAZ15_08510 [Sphingobacteriales bacterium]|nr:MAG: hypothetical protein EAZ15_08510 [Sphingobacteriales bacterium]